MAAKPKKPRAPRATFVPPTVEEVAAFIAERYPEHAHVVNPSKFVTYHQARGWVLKGGSPMRDWKAAVYTFVTNAVEKGW